MVVNCIESIVEMDDSEEDSSYLQVLQRLESGSDSDVSMDCRKRKRSHNMSWEEKIQLKKLRNRIAAQTSRDRKKARMDYLEDSLKELKTERDQFRQEMEELRKKNVELEKRNEQLAADLARITAMQREQLVSNGQPQRPAESFDPQQKGIRSLPAGPSPQAAFFLKTLILCTLTQTYCSNGMQKNNKNSQISCSEIWNRLTNNPNKMTIWQKIAEPLVEKNKHILTEWWGKQQNSWNPLDRTIIQCSA